MCINLKWKIKHLANKLTFSIWFATMHQHILTWNIWIQSEENEKLFEGIKMWQTKKHLREILY